MLKQRTFAALANTMALPEMDGASAHPAHKNAAIQHTAEFQNLISAAHCVACALSIVPMPGIACIKDYFAQRFDADGGDAVRLPVWHAETTRRFSGWAATDCTTFRTWLLTALPSVHDRRHVAGDRSESVRLYHGFNILDRNARTFFTVFDITRSLYHQHTPATMLRQLPPHASTPDTVNIQVRRTG